MPGIGHQSQRIPPQAKDEFDRDEGDIQADADRERLAKIGWRVNVARFVMRMLTHRSVHSAAAGMGCSLLANCFSFAASKSSMHDWIIRPQVKSVSGIAGAGQEWRAGPPERWIHTSHRKANQTSRPFSLALPVLKGLPRGLIRPRASALT